MQKIMLLYFFQKNHCSSVPTFPVKVKKYIHSCQSEIKTNLVDDLIFAAVHENPFIHHKDGEHKDADSNEHIYKFLHGFEDSHKHYYGDHANSNHHASQLHSHPDFVENHHHSPDVFYPSKDHHTSHPDVHHPSGNIHQISNAHHTPDISQHSSHDLHHPTHDLNYQSFPPYPPSHESVHASIEPHHLSLPISHETSHHSSHHPSSEPSQIASHDSRLSANIHSPADAHHTLAYYIGLAGKLKNANHNLNDKSNLKWHKRSTRGIFFGKSIHHDDKDDDYHHTKLISHEDQWLAGVCFNNYN